MLLSIRKFIKKVEFALKKHIMKTGKRKSFLILFLLATTLGHSQIIEPVKWATTTKKISETEYDLIITAQIDAGFHLYSQTVPEGGPLPTIFIFEESDNLELVGDMKEEKGHTVHDPVFDMKVKYFDTKATFTQRIKVRSKEGFKIDGEIEFMTCDDAKCSIGYDDFEFHI